MTFEEIENKLIREHSQGKKTIREAYGLGVRDALQEVKEAGITDFDLSEWDFSDLDMELSKLDDIDFSDFEDIDFSDLDMDFNLD